MTYQGNEMNRLTYTHWKHGTVSREVSPVGHGAGGRIRYAKDRATLYLIAESGNVYNAGRVIDGQHSYSAPVHIGWSATTTNGETTQSRH